ncbi:murein hydrolase activator EnvC family protein [Neolewinella agarilytica]|uniref:murein hydrolase activator EnvC family protein n=1 Tax=Neolewinella agarilytica TaxID=478744 RepID=UPI0023545355|nr:peptidoglycan DD-metalloendopeptidase family protein [Neolewinella agarilytica]
MLTTKNVCLRGLFLCLCLLAIGLGTLQAQSAYELKQKRQRLQQELKKTTRKLQATRTRRGAAVGQADLLRQQIEQRTELLETLREEVARNATRLSRDSGVVESLTDDLDRMGKEYGAALRAAHRAKLSQGWLTFLLSARGFNDAFRRGIHLQQYRTYRRRQSRLIRQTQLSLTDRIARLSVQRIEQDSLLFAAEDQDATLRQELDIQTEIVDQLSSSEKSLLATISRQQKQSEELQREIRKAISRVVAAEAKRAAAKRRTGNTAPAAAPIGSSIGSSRGKLGWPAQGTIVRRFGSQPHPQVPSVKIENSGVDIDAGPSASVEAIFEGKVISVRDIAGLGTVVMLSHGSYYTVYSNLEYPRIKVGQGVIAGEQLGLTRSEGGPLHFELWKGKTPLNPEIWLGE